MSQVDATVAGAPAAEEAAPTSPSAAARFVRAEHIVAGYSPWRHIALTLTIAGALTAAGVALATRARAVDWLLLPIFLVIANFLEWTVHRFPMHRPRPPRFMYGNHALAHHIAFTNRNMPIGPATELGLVMMPWYTMLGLFAVASPVMIVAGFLRGPGLSGVFLLGAVAYFLCYEVLHALYHLPDQTLNRALVGRFPPFRWLQAHHRHHHILSRMAHVNFNVTFPLMDRLLGTYERDAPKTT
jgi:sterol desaturase/sphingolipid hydroxylase (fatty acid hydroxylase superfamily)